MKKRFKKLLHEWTIEIPLNLDVKMYGKKRKDK